MSWGGGAKYRKPLLLQLGLNHSGLLLCPRHIQRGVPLGDDLSLIRFSTLLCSKIHFPGVYLVQLTRWELERAPLSTGQVTYLSFISYQPCQIPVLSWCFFPLTGIGLGAIIFYPEKAHWKQWPDKWGEKASHCESSLLAYLLTMASNLILLQLWAPHTF